MSLRLAYPKTHLLIAVITLFLQSINTSYAICNVTCKTSYSTANIVDLGRVNPYNYTNLTIPITLTIACFGNGTCPDVTNVSYTYDLNGGTSGDINSRSMSVFNLGVLYKICTSANCIQQYGNSNIGYEISNSYSFIPNIGRTDQYILYFIVPVQPLSSVGNYTDTLIGTFTYQY